jgi:hypothetical protein
MPASAVGLGRGQSNHRQGRCQDSCVKRSSGVFLLSKTTSPWSCGNVGISRFLRDSHSFVLSSPVQVWPRLSYTLTCRHAIRRQNAEAVHCPTPIVPASSISLRRYAAIRASLRDVSLPGLPNPLRVLNRNPAPTIDAINPTRQSRQQQQTMVPGELATVV